MSWGLAATGLQAPNSSTQRECSAHVRLMSPGNVAEVVRLLVLPNSHEFGYASDSTRLDTRSEVYSLGDSAYSVASSGSSCSVITYLLSSLDLLTTILSGVVLNDAYFCGVSGEAPAANACP